MIGKNILGQERVMIIVAYVNICLIWGSSNLITKIGVSSLSPTTFACLRFLSAGIILSAAALFLKKEAPKTFREYGVLLTIGLLMNFLTNGCVVIGNIFIDSGIVTVLLAVIPVITSLIEVFLLKTYKLKALGWAGLLGGFAGIAVMVLWGGDATSADMRGIVIVLLGSLFWSVGSLYSKEKVVSGSVVVHTAVESLFAALLFFVAGKMTGNFDMSPVNPRTLLPVVYLALFDSAIGFMSYIWLLKRLPSSKVCTYAYINPAVALILGAVILGESITIYKIAGMVIIILSVMAVQKDKVKQSIKPASTGMKAE